MKFKGISLQDRIKVPSQRTITDAGQMIVPCAFARTGEQTYLASQLGLKGNDKITVYRDEADVFASETMESFRSAPVTIGHPKDEQGTPILVDSENAKELQVGMLEGMPLRDEDLVTGTLVIARKDAIDLIDEGTQELSAGYTCDIEVVVVDGEEKYFQRNIKANHIAIVDRGRAGSNCRIADEDVAEPEAPEAEVPVADSVDPVVEDKIVTDEELLAKIQVQDEVITELREKLATFDQEVEAAVSELTEVILVAKELTDMEDFKGKTVLDIKKDVIAVKYPKINLADATDAYVNARFDILLEDGTTVTPMGQLLADQISKEPKTVKVTDPVQEARLNMINRFK